MLVIGALSLSFLWVASSLAPGKGLVFFGLGLAALSWALSKAGRGERQPLYRVFVVLLLAAVAVLGLEGVLLVFPEVLRGRLANYTFGGYHSGRGGIYRRDPHLGQALKPGFQRRLFWNGHWWMHETNDDGYRGPKLAQAAAVFLGDSMVYGHGLEWEQAVPAQAGRLGGFTVANLGQQGTGLVQDLILFREKGARLQPRRVFVCVHPNDAQDALDVYPVEELEAWLRNPEQMPVARRELREAPPSNIFDRWAEHVAVPLLGARLINGLRGKPDWVLNAPAPAMGERPIDEAYVPGPDARDAPYRPLAQDAPRDLRLGWLANRLALVELRRMVDAIGAELVVFDLGYPSTFSNAVEAISKELGATYCPAGRVALSRAVAGEPIYLAHDGHWTAKGAELVTRELLRRSTVEHDPPPRP